MFLKIEHIGIAVKDIAASEKLFESILGTKPYKKEHVVGESVDVSFFQTGESKIELLQASNGESVIAGYIERRGEGIHHIAFETDDILRDMERLKKEGFTLLHDAPKPGADNKLICFLHPKQTNGVLIELCQEVKE